MNGYPRDMFDEMDEMFARLFSRMHHEMDTGFLPASGYHVVYHGTRGMPAEPDLPKVQPRATRNPAAEVHQIDDEVMVVAELPGARPESVRISLDNTLLTISADEPEMPYHTQATLPPVDPATMQKTFRNGVLEVTFRRLADPENRSGS